MRFWALVGWIFIGALVSQAQQNSPGTSWAGEWGAFTRTGAGWIGYRGERLLISNCSGQKCELQISVQGDAGSHCDSSGVAALQVESDSAAVASLGGDKCTLSLTMTGSADAPSITAKNRSGDCSYYCTSGADFNRSFPLRARSPYFGDDIPACYLGTSRARMAICNSAPLAEEEKKWIDLSLQVSDLEQKKFDMMQGPAAFLAGCDSAADPAGCLQTEFDRSSADLLRRKEVWLAQVTDAGDPEEAARKIAAIAGRYRHSFKNGDVQGETFRSVDKLLITKVSGDTIRYSLVLNFYNGHECSREGTASYKKNGTFVDQVKEDSGDTCYFEIAPTSDGVRLLDPTGICRNNDCGARGGYNGAGFSFAEKVRPVR